jgi:tRNA uracil 4-sulfurtransferase
MKALLLISGGFDSAVAGKVMQDQGIELVALHLSFEPLTDTTAKDKSIALAKHLGIKKIVITKVGNLLADFTKKCKHKNYFVLQKRLFLRLAEQVAKENDCKYIITGDNLGQVSSQTLSNLDTITKVISMPVLRPLLAYDKTEITDLAKEFNTFEMSKGPEMCDVLGPKHPATRSINKDLENDETQFSIEDLETEVIEL